ncbi:MAG TPA: hypothetical protein IAC60_01460 [Candidatus Enterosoma merdigallinarum]|nr:hypothetical protein [Candidatus Enterosoma merdigallinarum]
MPSQTLESDILSLSVTPMSLPSSIVPSPSKGREDCDLLSAPQGSPLALMTISLDRSLTHLCTVS